LFFSLLAIGQFVEDWGRRRMEGRSTFYCWMKVEEKWILAMVRMRNWDKVCKINGKEHFCAYFFEGRAVTASIGTGGGGNSIGGGKRGRNAPLQDKASLKSSLKVEVRLI
jgi:hypothetical protein